MLATIPSRTYCLLVCRRKNLKIRIYKTITLPMVPYRCETWYLTLREELRVCEVGVLKKTYRAKRDELTGGWRMHNELA
jgi:hypothetical protein